MGSRHPCFQFTAARCSSLALPLLCQWILFGLFFRDGDLFRIKGIDSAPLSGVIKFVNNRLLQDESLHLGILYSLCFTWTRRRGRPHRSCGDIRGCNERNNLKAQNLKVMCNYNRKEPSYTSYSYSLKVPPKPASRISANLDCYRPLWVPELLSHSRDPLVAALEYANVCSSRQSLHTNTTQSKECRRCPSLSTALKLKRRRHLKRYRRWTPDIREKPLSLLLSSEIELRTHDDGYNKTVPSKVWLQWIARRNRDDSNSSLHSSCPTETDISREDHSPWQPDTGSQALL